MLRSKKQKNSKKEYDGNRWAAVEDGQPGPWDYPSIIEDLDELRVIHHRGDDQDLSQYVEDAENGFPEMESYWTDGGEWWEPVDYYRVAVR